MNHYLIAYVFVHLVCATLSYGIWFAHMQREYRSLANRLARQDLVFSICAGLVGGPISLLTTLMLTGFAEHGLLFWPENNERP